jgi:hypothetical protein
LEGLAKRTATNPGAPFVPDTLVRLVALKKEDRAAFEVLRAELTGAGAGVTALDEAIAEESGDTGGRGRTQADILVDLAQTAELFHGSDGTGFADLDINGHRETWPIRAKGFRRWLARSFFETTQGAPSSEALQSALNVIEAKAHFDSPERIVHVRVGGLNERLYLDLGDATWRAVEIDAAGWRMIDNPPVRFRRAAGMQPLPVPVAGGSIEILRSFLNVQSDNDFVLVVAWALAVLRNRGPYPVIVLSGEQGSAKSTFSAIFRALLDPNTAPLRALPREDRDLFIAASNGHVLAFDNVSGLPGGFRTRFAGWRQVVASLCASNRDEAVEGVIDADPIATADLPFAAASPAVFVQRRFCAKSASRSASGGRDEREPAPSTSRQSSHLQRQKSRGRNRPRRPHRPRLRRNPFRPTASRHSPCGRYPAMRTKAAEAMRRPSAPTH